MAFKVGDRVQYDLDADYNRRYPLRPTHPGGKAPDAIGVCTITRVGNHEDTIYIADAAGTIYGPFYARRFKPAETRAATAMSREMATEQRDRLLAAGVPKELCRIRSRSWDNEGLYFAVDVASSSEMAGRKLYKPADVDAYLAEREALLKPLDLEPFMTSSRLSGTVPVYQFKANGTFIPAPDGSYWWTEADMRRVGGIAKWAGKRYRFGREEFVPFVK